MAAESLVFYRSFWATLEKIPNEGDRCKMLSAIMSYGLDDAEPVLEYPLDALWEAIKPQIDANKKRRENGSKGGRPAKEVEPEAEPEAPDAAEEKTIGYEDKNHRLSGAKPNVNVNDNVNVNVNDNDNTHSTRAARFTAPTPDQVSEYVAERGYTGFDVEHFIDYYTANGWRVGKNPMKDWRAAVRNWQKNGFSTAARSSPATGKGTNFTQRKDDFNAIAERIMANQAKAGGNSA